MKRRTIPRTDSIRELAAFWDTHDVTDFDGLLEEVSEPVFQKRSGQAVRDDAWRRPVTIEFGLVRVPVELFLASAKEARERESFGVDGILKIECFVPADKLPPAVLSCCSRLGPHKRGQKAYRLLVEGMKAAGCRALVTSGSRGEDRTFFLRLLENSLVLERVRSSRAILSHGNQAPVKLKRSETDLARQLIEQLAVEEIDPQQWSSTEPTSRKAPVRTSSKARVVLLDDWIARCKRPAQTQTLHTKTRRRRPAR
jgi:hypothetical protein